MAENYCSPVSLSQDEAGSNSDSESGELSLFVKEEVSGVPGLS